MASASSPRKISRRGFGKTVGAAASTVFGFSFIPSHAWGNLEKPTLGAVGTAGKGRADISGAVDAGFQVAALVDVFDADKLKSEEGKRLQGLSTARRTYPNARFFTDYREMLEKMGDKVDAVTVSTPDHHHFHASALAMLAGKHVYCQKPLTHGIWEARHLSEIAAQTGVKTQMGNQAHARDPLRRCVELVRAGVVGKVSAVHTWTNRPIWPQGFAEPPQGEPVPSGVDWEQWIGPAPFVNYSSKIAPFSWRGWWDYGTGALGDMACHIMDMPYWALASTPPRSVFAKQKGATELSPPISSKITWDFAANDLTVDSGFKFHWYDGYVDASFDRESWSLEKNGKLYNHPGEDVLDGMDFRQYGSVIVGTEGKLFFHRGKKHWALNASSDVDGFAWPEKTIQRARQQNNYFEWMDAIQGKVDQGQSHFGYAGPFTEMILLGVLAQRVPNVLLEWDAESLAIKGRSDLQPWIRRDYRSGWQWTA